jgi:hypothetical protein
LPAGTFKIGLLAQGTYWTLYINDQKVDVVSLDDGGAKYVGIRSYLDKENDDGSVTFSYDNFEFWVP